MFSIRSLAQSRYPLAIASGLLLAMSFPKIGVAGFAWIAPAVMLAAGLGKRGAESFRIGYVAGLAHYLISMHWLLFIPVTGFPILGWVALCAYLALYPATWVWLAVRLSGVRCQVPGAPGTITNWLGMAAEISSWTWSRRMVWVVCCGAIWVALELILARLLGGFPWNPLGASQHEILPLIQYASMTGVYGVSFLVACTSVSLLCAVAVVLARPGLRWVWMGEIILPFTAIVAAFAFGLHQLRQTPVASRELAVTLIQPSIPQTLIWDARENTNRFRQVLDLSSRALAEKTDLLVWPEAALPQSDESSFVAITNLIRSHHVWMLFGADDFERRANEARPEEYDVFNAAFLVDPESRLAAKYHKRNLVIFGEYIPLEHWLPFVKWFTPVQGSFTPGEHAVPFEFELDGWGERPREPRAEAPNGSPGVPPHQRVKTSVLICFEDAFPALARECVEPDTDFLVNLTNDGWFGEGAAQWQHAANAAFRALENGVPLIRCTNTGLTCWFDSTGRLREFFVDKNGGIYGPGFITVRIPLPAPGESRLPTFYNQHGDWFGWGCACLAGVALIRAMWRPEQRQTP